MEIILRKKLWNIQTPYINANLGGQMFDCYENNATKKQAIYFLKNKLSFLMQNIIFKFQI